MKSADTYLVLLNQQFTAYNYLLSTEELRPTPYCAAQLAPPCSTYINFFLFFYNFFLKLYAYHKKMYHKLEKYSII